MSDKYLYYQTGFFKSSGKWRFYQLFRTTKADLQMGKIAVCLEHTQNFLSNSEDLAILYAFLLPQLVNLTFLQIISSIASHKI